MVQYSIDVNFTLTIIPQRDSYYHHTVITAQVLNSCKYICSCTLSPVHSNHGDSSAQPFFKMQTFSFKVPPEITAQCSDGGITFSVVRPPRAESLWEVGVDNEPLTSQLAAQRGYRLHNDTHRTTLEIPVFSVGYSYEVRVQNAWGSSTVSSVENIRITWPEFFYFAPNLNIFRPVNCRLNETDRRSQLKLYLFDAATKPGSQSLS